MTGTPTSAAWMPHSDLVASAQRPARSSSPGSGNVAGCGDEQEQECGRVSE
ncbi:MAG: hypothetical protein HY271_18390 [Deltaproteobacteria bacterium]|nr:hypothetical protein [Deltaproteobacteria bacterium]